MSTNPQRSKTRRKRVDVTVSSGSPIENSKVSVSRFGNSARSTTSTDNQRQKGNAIRIAFIAICATLALLPLIGMIWAPTNETSENRRLAEFPSLIDENGLNMSFLSELGSYFEDHFAFKNLFVSANATLSTQILASPNPDAVILGQDGWLYYVGDANDYYGQDVLSPHEIDNLAFDLVLVRNYCSEHGARFAATVIPNKMTVYPEHLPYYMGEPGGNDTLTLMGDAMKSDRISYFDAYETFMSSDDVHYYLRDSHWNSNGARIAAEGLLRCLGNERAANRLDKLTPDWVQDYLGDLNKMMYPDNAMPEYEAHFEDQLNWNSEEGESIEDDWIKTTSKSQGASGILVMYRDSFGNNMVQFMADVFKTAYFTREVPYDLSLVDELGATDVIFEYVERNLRSQAANPAIMLSPTFFIADDMIDMSGIDVVQDPDEISMHVDGDYLVIEGCIPEEYANESTTEMYVGVEMDGIAYWYVPFRVTISGNSYGYRAFVDKEVDSKKGKVAVIVKNDNEFKLVQITDH